MARHRTQHDGRDCHHVFLHDGRQAAVRIGGAVRAKLVHLRRPSDFLPGTPKDDLFPTTALPGSASQASSILPLACLAHFC